MRWREEVKLCMENYAKFQDEDDINSCLVLVSSLMHKSFTAGFNASGSKLQADLKDSYPEVLFSPEEHNLYSDRAYMKWEGL